MRKIAIISGKGGVGKTTITANLGTILATRGINCVAVDANIGAPNLGLHLNMIKTPFDITDVMTGKVRSDNPAFIDQNGLKVLPASLDISEKYKKAALKKLPRVFSQIHADIILVDCPPGVNEETKEIVKTCNEVVLVTTPDLPSVTAGSQVIEQARKSRRKITGVVLNRVLGKDYEMKQSEVSGLCNCNILAAIPEDHRVPESIAERIPIVKYRPTSPAALALEDLASVILKHRYKPHRPNIIERIIHFIQDLIG